MNRHPLPLAVMAFAIQFQWAALSTVLIPTDLLRLVSEAEKARYLGGIAAAGAVIAILGQPLAGAWSDRARSRWGRRRPFIVAGTCLGLPGLLAMALAPNVTWYLAGFLVSEVFGTFVVAAYHGLWRDHAPAGRVGLLSGYVELLSVLGNMLGLAAGGVLAGGGSTRPAYLALIGVFLAGALFTVRRVPDGPAPASDGPAAGSAGSAGSAAEPGRDYFGGLWGALRSHRDFTVVWVHRVLVMAGLNTVTVFLEYYVRDVLRVPGFVGATSLLGAVVMVAALAASVRAGTLSDRMGRKGLVMGTGLVMGGAVLGLAVAGSFPVALALGVVFGLAYGAFSTVDLALGLDTLPSAASAARDIAIWNVTYHVARLVAPVIGGWVLTHAGPSGAAAGYQVLYGLAFLYYLAGSLLVLRVRGVR